jgi:hypothetical protein
MLKEIKKDFKKWRNILCSELEDNTLRISVPISLINKLNQNPGRTFAEK